MGGVGGWDRSVGRVPDLELKDCEFDFWKKWQEQFLLQSKLFLLTLMRC